MVVGRPPDGQRPIDFDDARSPASRPSSSAEPTSETRRHSGSTRRAARGARRAASTCSTTCASAPSVCARRARHRPSATVASASPSSSSRTASATACISARGRRDGDSPGRARAAADVYDVIERHRPTLFFRCRRLRDAAGARREPATSICPRPLRRVGGRGAAAGAVRAVSERFGLEILDGIGSTEVLHIFISNRPRRVRPGSSGMPVPGYEARLVDETARRPRRRDRQPAGQGRLHRAYYWNRHEQTRATIDGDWIRTGDKYSRTPTASTGSPGGPTTC